LADDDVHETLVPEEIPRKSCTKRKLVGLRFKAPPPCSASKLVKEGLREGPISYHSRSPSLLRAGRIETDAYSAWGSSLEGAL